MKQEIQEASMVMMDWFCMGWSVALIPVLCALICLK